MKPESEKPDPSSKQTTEMQQEYDEFVKTVDAFPYLEALLKDASELLPDNLYSESARLRDTATIKRRLAHEGLRFATSTLPLVAAGLFEHLEIGRGRFPSFKIKKETGHPVFLSGLFRLAYDELSAHQSTAIWLIYQISVSFKKLRGPYPESVLSKQLRDFVDTNNRNENLNFFNEADFPIIQRARVYVERLFKNFNTDQVIPRPGPGATNKPVAKHLRYRPHVLYTKLDDVCPYVEFFNVNAYDSVHQTKFYLDLYKRKRYEPRARLKWVFKQFLKARGICIEENESQYLQQAYKNAMYHWIESHPLTRGFINFTDQSINAALALKSSEDREYATLDESDASNNIAKDVVAWMFQDTALYEPLMALSTSWIDLPDKVDGMDAIRTRMYAPMGSGLCFPVMSVVHWALCKAILDFSLSEGSTKDVYVYGDDVILPRQGYQSIVDWLPRFGMKINTSKSFCHSYFRESCGTHAYKGMDITPVYIKYTPSTSIDSAMSCIAVEKQFFDRQCIHVAQVLREQVKRFHGNIPFVNVNSSVFGFKRDDCVQPSNFNELRRKYDQYGNVLFRARLVKSQQLRDQPPTEEECYLRRALTKAHSRFIGGEPFNQEAKWSYVSYPQLIGLQPPKWLETIIPTNGDPNEIDQQKQKSGLGHLHHHLCPYDLYEEQRSPYWSSYRTTKYNFRSRRRADVLRYPDNQGWKVVHHKDGVGMESHCGFCQECSRYRNYTCYGSEIGPDLPRSFGQLPFRVPFRWCLDRALC